MERYILDHTDRSNPIITSRAHLAASLALGYNLTAVEATKWLISPKATSLLGKIITVDLYGRKSREHVLVRRPQCPECGHGKDRNQTHPGPLHLVSRKKEFCEDGGHRTHTPRQTYERYKHHISPILGTVTELRPAFGPKSQLVPSYIAGHNFAMGIDSIVFLQESLRGMSGGKGSTEIQAKVSGLCEAIERYSGLYAGDEYRIRGTYADLKPEAIHPNDCMGFSEEQYQHRRKLNVSNPRSRCLLIPDPFDENLTIDWTPAWSLTGEKFRYLPAAYCYYGHPEFGESRWCNPDSNGSAAGNTLEEAILQGFMELIERDAVALWWYNRIKRPAVDLGSFNLPYVDAILDYYDRLHRRLWVLDITSDLNIATFACISPCSNRPSEDIVLGFGAHFDPKIALLRAITEVNQFLPSILLTNPDGSTQYLFGDDLAVEWWRTARIQDHGYTEKEFKAVEKFILENGIECPSFTVWTPLPGIEDGGTNYNKVIRLQENGRPDWSELDFQHPVIETKLPRHEFMMRYGLLYQRTSMHGRANKPVFSEGNHPLPTNLVSSGVQTFDDFNRKAHIELARIVLNRKKRS